MGSRGKHKIKKERMSQLSKAARSHRKYRDKEGGELSDGTRARREKVYMQDYYIDEFEAKDREIERLRAGLAASTEIRNGLLSNLEATNSFVDKITIARLEAANKQLREGLRQLEWLPLRGSIKPKDSCYVCGNWRSQAKHKPDCWLAKLLEGRE